MESVLITRFLWRRATQQVEQWQEKGQDGLVVELAISWGRAVIHVFEQGFASAFWLGLMIAYSLRFVLRFRKDYHLLDEQGNRRLTWKIVQGKRGWSERTVWDARRARSRESNGLGPAGHPS